MNSSGCDDEFAHRQNADGTFDSICLSCYLTVSSALSESELVDGEANHWCTKVIGYTNCHAERTFWRGSNAIVLEDDSDIDAMLGRGAHHD
jgi:hypothetical protein